MESSSKSREEGPRSQRWNLPPDVLLHINQFSRWIDHRLQSVHELKPGMKAYYQPDLDPALSPILDLLKLDQSVGYTYIS